MVICQPRIKPKNPHLQSFLASSPWRLRHLPKKAKFLASSEKLTIEVDAATLEGHYSQNGDHLVIIIHGWEGSAQSTYVQMMAHRMYEAGCSVLRLNMRDHGDTHHLNEALFHSCRIGEMVQALSSISTLYPHHKISLCGFSLGGNFALRMASLTDVDLQHVYAISPPIKPKNSMKAIQNSQIYQKYFLKKWRRSLLIKQEIYPHLFAGHQWQQETSIAQLTEDFVLRHTDFKSVDDYFAAYTITPELIKNIKAPTQIISSWDDPVIPSSDLSTIDRLPQAKILVTPNGGHCGFIQGWSMRSWVEEHIINEICHEST